MTVSCCVRLLRPDPGTREPTATLGEVLARLQQEAEAQLGDPNLADAVARHALISRLGEVRVSMLPDGLEELDEEAPSQLPVAS